MILILAEDGDGTADHVAGKLQERGANFVRFDTARFPTQAELSLAFTPAGEGRYRLRVGGESLDLSRVTAVWHRRSLPPVPHPQIVDAQARTFAQAECKAFLQEAWDCMDCLWVPAPRPVLLRAQHKPLQLKIASSLGFELPPTLVTTSPEDVREFYCRHNGNVISKLSGIAFADSLGNTFWRYSEVVSKRDIAYAGSVRFCPVIFQAYVPKRVELRITVVGQQVFAAAIHSQESNHTRHDWRRYDSHQTQYSIHRLPEELVERCVRLTQQFGLSYGAIDMILTPDGRYVFLEINPCGQYLWVESATGLPISDALCDLLINPEPACTGSDRAFISNGKAP
jgi:hypothetical protein